ncbi:hypothetical protein EV383_4584 [Pseudonocardia sediminis]|uniref:DUF4190 domain-containing protein n=1 Tax=Pseudonocardia sediminis TaxID=1397368 RepID=A0A4Q7V2E6_PSEST|nr:DUF4190 domain-containing protein [Pseudonocardia sediminis]RZT87658.1 hypothetical protein EV383_4584 [Pseudonocardia sediminis]
MTQHYPPQQWGYPQQPAPRQMNNGLGTASLVLGLLGAIFALLPIIGVIAWPMVIIGLVLGLIGVTRAQKGEADNKGVAIAGVVLSAVGLMLCFAWVALFSSAADSASRSQASAPTYSAAAPTYTAPAVEKPAAAAIDVNNLTEGSYLVGKDIPAGRYKTSGAQGTNIIDACTWSRNKDDSGEFDSIIANGIINKGQGSVTAKDGEFLDLSGDCVWTRQ